MRIVKVIVFMLLILLSCGAMLVPFSDPPTYEGVRVVSADDDQEAIDKVKAWVHREITTSMYSESYKIIDVECA